MRIFWLIVRTIIILILTFIGLGIANGATWVIGIGGGLMFFSVIMFIMSYDASAKSYAIVSFIGTIVAAIVRIAVGGAGGIAFYVTASITNAATCYSIGYGDVIARKEYYNRKCKEKLSSNLFYSAQYYADQKYYAEQSDKKWTIINCVIFGLLALVGCFKPVASFLPLIYIVLRSLLVWFRNR